MDLNQQRLEVGRLFWIIWGHGSSPEKLRRRSEPRQNSGTGEDRVDLRDICLVESTFVRYV